MASRKTASRALVVPDLEQLAPPAQTSHVGSSHVWEVPTWEESRALGERVRRELELIEAAEKTIPLRAVFLGIILAQIRASLDHGKWAPWLKEYFGGRKNSAYRYIAIARACVSEAKIYLPELVAVRQLQLDMTAGNPRADAAKALKKMQRWVDGRSLRELYAQYANGQPRLGGARNGSRKPVIDLDALKAQKREEAAGVIERGRALFLQENICQYLEPEEIRGVVESLEALATDVKHAVRPLLKKGA